MIMWIKNNFTERIMPFLLVVGLLLIVSSAQAEDTISISGEWEVYYEDRGLGGVKGRVVVSEDESSAQVVLEHPETGEKYTLNSTEIRRDQNNIEIILEGRSPESGFVDGYGYPDQAITISEGISKISLSVGDNKAQKAIKPRNTVDLDRVSIKMVLEGYDQMQGFWSYEAEPITERDQEGFGRVGVFGLDEDGKGIQKGWELWERPIQVIVGAFPVEDQLNIVRYLEKPAYPHPFQGNEHQDKYIRRTIFIFGKNLPKDLKSAVFESGSEFVTCGVIKFPDSAFQMPGDLNPFARGKKKLLEYTDPEEHEALLKLDFIVVEVKIKDGVKPGLQSFRLNNQESSWMLQFGDNRADINFVRKVDPQKVTGNDLKWENTQDLFIPEYMRLEVRTEVILDVDKIDVTIGKNGKVKKLGKKVLIPAIRSTEDPRVYRTGPIALIKSSGSPLPPPIGTDNVVIPVSKRVGDITVENMDVLTAAIAEEGLISVVPPPARADIHTSPSKISGRVSYLWKDHLVEAATCYDMEIKDWDRDNNVFVDEISERLVLEGKLEDLQLVTLPGIIKEIFFGTKLKTHFQLGDHAAMLLMRQIFLEMLEKTIYSFANDYNTDKQILAYRRYIDPFRWNAMEHPITSPEFAIKVKGKDGQEVDFFETFGVENEEQNPENIDPWVFRATREAIDQYIQILFKSKEMAEEIESCNVEELLKLTGNTFEAVEYRLTPRLMQLDADAKKETFIWTPDYKARLMVYHIASKFDQFKAFQTLSEQDTQNLIMATAILTLPIHMSGGAIAAAVVTLAEVGFESYLSYDKYSESQHEIEFATGTADILGYGRYRRAKENEFDYVDLSVQVAMVIGMEVVGGKLFETVVESAVKQVNKTYKFFQKGLRRLRAKRGKAILEEHGFDIDAVATDLKPKELRNIAEYITEAAILRNAKRTLDNNQLKVLAHLDKKSAQFNKRPEWAKNFDEALHNDLKDLYYRRGGDIKGLMENAPDVVKGALRGEDRALALSILRSSPQRTGEQFQRALALRKMMIRIDRTNQIRFMDQVGEADLRSQPLLEDGHWDFKFEGPDEDGIYTLTALGPNGSAAGAQKAKVINGYKDGTFTMKEAFIYDENPWIKVGLDVPLVEGKGVPTIQFMILRAMKKFGIGFGGSGENLNRVILGEVVNTPTTIHVHWIKRTYFKGKTLEELADNPHFLMLVMETPGVVGAKNLLEKAGYEITGIRLNVDPPKIHHPSAKGVMTNYKPLRGDETAEEFYKRFGLPADEKVPVLYDIELDVRPIKQSEQPKELLIVDEFELDTPAEIDDVLKPKEPLRAEEFNLDAERIKEWGIKRNKQRAIEAEEKEKRHAELMARRAAAERFKPPEEGRLANDDVGYLVAGDTLRLADMMSRYRAVQPVVFEGNINKYAQDMINKDFDWSKVRKDDRIVLDPDGKTVKHGHHRFIAAHLAAEATGRRVMDGPGAIIPREGFGPRDKAFGSLGHFKIKVSEGFSDPEQ